MITTGGTTDDRAWEFYGAVRGVSVPGYWIFVAIVVLTAACIGCVGCLLLAAMLASMGGA